MRRIYDFTSFARLYEAEGEDKKVLDYKNLIQLTLANFLNCYKKQILLAKDPYDAPKIVSDYDSVASAPGVDSLKKILDKIKSLSADDAKDTADAWSKAGESFLGVLSKIYEKLPDSKEEVNNIVTEFMNQGKANLQSASGDYPEATKALQKAGEQAKEEKDGQKKDTTEKTNESVEYLYDEIIFEGILDLLKGKRAVLRDISQEIKLEGSKLKDLSAQGELKGIVDQQLAELEKISSEVGKLVGEKNKDIKDEDIQKLRDRLAEVPKKIEAKQKEIAQKDQTTKEAGLLFVKATEDLSSAEEKHSAYKAKKDAEKAAQKAEEDKKKKEEDDKKKGEQDVKEKEEGIASEKKELGFEKTITKKDVGNKKDDTVQKIQKLIDRKFGKKIKDSEAFKKFSEGKYAGDGYFGDNTEKVIKGIKAGLGMKSDDSDITEELMDKILSLKESESSKYGRFKSFEAFESESLVNEKYYSDVKFDLDKFLEIADDKKSDKKEETKVNPEEIISTLKKEAKVKEEVEKKYSKEVEELASKDFKVSDTGKEVFLSVAGISWDEYSKQDEDKRKEIAAKVIASLNLRFGIEVEKVVKNLLQAK